MSRNNFWQSKGNIYLEKASVVLLLEAAKRGSFNLLKKMNQLVDSFNDFNSKAEPDQRVSFPVFVENNSDFLKTQLEKDLVAFYCLCENFENDMYSMIHSCGPNSGTFKALNIALNEQNHRFSMWFSKNVFMKSNQKTEDDSQNEQKITLSGANLFDLSSEIVTRLTNLYGYMNKGNEPVEEVTKEKNQKAKKNTGEKDDKHDFNMKCEEDFNDRDHIKKCLRLFKLHAQSFKNQVNELDKLKFKKNFNQGSTPPLHKKGSVNSIFGVAPAPVPTTPQKVQSTNKNDVPPAPKKLNPTRAVRHSTTAATELKPTKLEFQDETEEVNDSPVSEKPKPFSYASALTGADEESQQKEDSVPAESDQSKVAPKKNSKQKKSQNIPKKQSVCQIAFYKEDKSVGTFNVDQTLFDSLMLTLKNQQ